MISSDAIRGPLGRAPSLKANLVREPSQAPSPDLPPTNGFSLELTSQFDSTSLLPVEFSSLYRGFYTKCLCFHPERPLLAVGVSSYVGVCDLLSGCRIGTVEIRHTPIKMVFSTDGTLLIMATAEWHIVAVNTLTWRHWRLAPRKNPPDKPLESVLLCVSPGARPVVFFCKYGKDAVRMAYSSRMPTIDAKGREVKEKDLKWGIKLKMDVHKPIVGLATNPVDFQLLVQHLDGALRGYTMAQASLVPLWAIQLTDTGLSLQDNPVVMEVAVHPFEKGAAMLLQGSQAGNALMMELVGRNDPKMIMKARTPHSLPVVGMGIHKASKTLSIYLQSQNGGALAYGWQLYQVQGSVTLGPTLVHPRDVGDMVSKSISPAATPPPSTATDKSTVMWQQLWMPAGSWQTASVKTSLLGQIAPVVVGVALQPALGLAALHLAPPDSLLADVQAMLQTVQHMSPQEVAAMRHTASVPILRQLSNELPFCGWEGAAVQRVHTPLHFWQGSPGGLGKLQFPRHVYYLDASQISKYALASKLTGKFCSLPLEDAQNQPQRLSYMVHSAKKGAWLVFMEVVSAVAPNGRWNWTLLTETGLVNGDQNRWLQHGKYGVFLGVDDAHFAIMQAESANVGVFATGEVVGTTPPLYVIALDKPALHYCSILPGPPQLPQKSPATAASLVDAAPEAVHQGCIIWTAEDDVLRMGGVSSSTERDENAKGSRKNMLRWGKLKSSHSLQMLPGERVLDIAWQVLQPGSRAPKAVVGAIMTNKRMLIVNAALQVVTATDPADALTGGVLPYSSFIWAGPALLYLTAAGQVKQLLWSGKSTIICSVAAYPQPVLSAALADGILLLRKSVGRSNWEVSSRPMSMLQPLVLGWASLDAAGMAPSASVVARQALQSIVQQYDASQASSSTVWHLINNMCYDLAAVLAKNSVLVDDSAQLAAAAAAGKWSHVTSRLITEYTRSVYFPRPPTPESSLHQKLVAGASGAVLHGQFSQALELLQAAGEWEMAMLLCLCQADLDSIRTMAQQLQAASVPNSPSGLLPKHAVPTTERATELARMARALIMAHPSPPPGVTKKDWNLKLVGPDGTQLMTAEAWTLADTGAVPGMETTSFNSPGPLISEAEIGTIPNTDTHNLYSYLGMSNVSSLNRLPSAGMSKSPSGMLDANILESMGPLPPVITTNNTGVDQDSEDSDSGGQQGEGAGTSKDDFYSDDEDLFGLEPAKPKFKINIKSKEEVQGQQSANTAQLKEAAKSLQLLPSPTSARSGANSPFHGLGISKPSPLVHSATADNMGFTNAFGPNPSSAPPPLMSGLALPPPQFAPPPGGSIPPPLPDLFSSLADPSSTPAPELHTSFTQPTASLSQPQPSLLSPPGTTPQLSPFPGPTTALPPNPALFPLQGPSSGLSPLQGPVSGLSPLPGPNSGISPLPGPSSRVLPLPGPGAIPALRGPGSNMGLLPLPGPGGIPGFGGSGPNLGVAPLPGPGGVLPPPSAPMADPLDDLFGLQPVAAPAPTATQVRPAFPAPPTVPSSAAVDPLADFGFGVPAPMPPAQTAAAAPSPLLDLDDLFGGGTASQAAPASGPGGPSALFQEGTSAMEAANWAAAGSKFAAALQALGNQPDGPAKATETARTVQYYAAVKLLSAATKGGPSEARLYRYIAALKLEDKHRLMLVKTSVACNKKAGNYRYAADQLTWLITKSLGEAPMEYMAKLQEMIDECDRQGSRNSSVPGDENAEFYQEIIAAATNAADVDSLLAPVLNP